MLRKSLSALAPLALGALVSAQSVAAESYTTRIEPRPFYGAVVTLEEGVRVIRPLPPERHVIINPDNKTPLTLSFNETHVTEHRVIENHNAGANGKGDSVVYGRGGGLYSGFAGGVGAKGHMGHHHMGHEHGGHSGHH